MRPDTSAWLKGALESGVCTRSSLATELCERENWRNPLGAPCLASARTALPKLAAKLGLALPEALPVGGATAASRAAPPDYPDLELDCALGDLGPVAVVPVDDCDKHLARSMMATHHPEGDAACPGGRIRYWIASERYGRLGGLVFGAASWHQKARDLYIGWSQAARDANLGRVLNNDRFLILPSARVPGLASHALSLAAERVARDWEGRYGELPVLLYSYVGPEREGTSYRAAGWELCAGLTSGAPPGRREPGPRRSVWMKPLAADWREALGREPSRAIGWAPGSCGVEDDWAEQEYGRSSCSDSRLRARMVAMGRAWTERPGASVPALFPGEADQKAAYRFLSNPHVAMDNILEPHREAMADRCRPQPLVLAVQDTTMLNYSGLEATEGLVDIGGGGSGSVGVAAHFGVAFSEGGCALGVFHLDADFRETVEAKAERKANSPPGTGKAGKSDAKEKEKESRRWREGLDKALELAEACPDTRVVAICDREGDSWDLMEKAHAREAEALFRASRSTQRRAFDAAGDKRDLWVHAAEMPLVAVKTIDIEACGGPRAREKRTGVRLEVRAGFVDLVPPKDKPRGTPPLRMLAVRVLEIDPPPSAAEPLDWLLLATFGDATPDHALQLVTWYEKRWLIEEYFGALKVGTRIKDRKLNLADDLRKCLAFDAVTACTVMSIERLARSMPDAPARTVVHMDEITVLAIHMSMPNHRRQRGPPDPNQTIASFVVNTARLAGFIPRKRQPLPGTKKLWEGYVLLSLFVQHSRVLRKYEQYESTASG